jgi:outer membrane protein, heavy metal efflux system
MKPRARALRTPRTTTARSVTVAGLLAVASFSPAAGADEIEGTRRVCARGPVTRLVDAQRARAEAGVAAAAVLPNPELIVEHQRTLKGPSEQETTVGIALPLGIGGRRFLLQDAAAARRDQASAEGRATLFEHALGYREAYAAALLDQERLAILEEQQRALDALTATIAALAKRGERAGYDLLRQRTQAQAHRQRVSSMRGRAGSSRAAVEAWTGEPVTLARTDLATLAGGAQASAVATRSEASGASAKLKALEAAARASAIDVRAAHRRWVPDLRVFVGYRAVSGAAPETGHGVSLGVTVPITFFDHGQGEAAQADAERRYFEAQATTTRLEVGARAKAAASRLRALEGGAAELERIAADAAALEEKARQLYAAGEFSMTDLLDAFRAGEEARLARIDAYEELVSSRLALMRARGSLFHPLLDRVCGRGGHHADR